MESVPQSGFSRSGAGTVPLGDSIEYVHKNFLSDPFSDEDGRLVRTGRKHASGAGK